MTVSASTTASSNSSPTSTAASSPNQAAWYHYSTKSPATPASSKSPANAPARSPSAPATSLNAAAIVMPSESHDRSAMRNEKISTVERMGVTRGCARRSSPRASSRLIGRLFRRAMALLLISLSGLSPLGVAQKKQKLDRVYREWLERDAAYIITKDERDAFLRLATDAARDKFIESFWEIRNPNPGSPTNTYKDEIYQRIAFADTRFGVGSGLEGWRTERGHTYIALGPPQQKQVFRNSANLYPIEIWFYSSPTPALPPFFYVMFYQRAGSGDYRFYSAY